MLCFFITGSNPAPRKIDPNYWQVAVVGRFYETPIFVKMASAAADALQFGSQVRCGLHLSKYDALNLGARTAT
jgi:hypothetical protein